MGFYDSGWRPYISKAGRRRRAERQMGKILKKGQTPAPIMLQGRAIAETFWGKAWCENLDRYSDYVNRLPRGRAYLRNGSVMDLQIAPGAVDALVSGSKLYRVEVGIAAVPKARWRSICNDCAGEINSLVELLHGRFSKVVMERLCQQKTGLFPQPSEIEFSCTCPDWVAMCKHVAAVLYGIGARLDDEPELLFKLRKVDGSELIAKAGAGLSLTKNRPPENKLLPSEGLAEIFGLDLVADPGGSRPRAVAKKTAGKQRTSVKGKTKKRGRKSL
jgi:uncharacterized Zn finger protein